MVRDTDGRPATKAEAKAIIAERFTVPEEIRRCRRNKKVGKVPHQVLVGHVSGQRSRRDNEAAFPARSSAMEASASTTQEGGG